MLKKIFLLMTFTISLIAFTSTITNAALLIKGLSGLSKIGPIKAEFDVAGGDNPNVATFLLGTYGVGEGCLIGVNPKGKDVSVGIAGIGGMQAYTPSVDLFIDQNGRQFLNQIVYDTVDEFGSVDDFLEAWGLTDYWESLINNNWTPDSVFVTWFEINGDFLTDCDCADQSDPTTCDITTCDTVYGGDQTWNCITPVECRDAADQTFVQYVCNEDGYPIGVPETYSVRSGRTLSVKSPGVLANDWDEEDDPLKAYLDSDAMHGTVTLNGDGSFTYTPADEDPPFAGTDSFTYYSSDGSSNSNITTVVILVE